MGHSKKTRSQTRRGSIYVVTMSTALIVAVLATTALTTTRVQRLAGADAKDMRQAQVYAESALELAQYRIKTSTNYRSQLASGTWSTDQSMGDGFFKFTGSDPLDNDLTDANYDPIAIIATGKKGNCVHKLRGTFVLTQPGINCLGSGVHAGENLTVDNATLESYLGPSSSNVLITALNNGKIYANCESATSANTSGGGQIIGTILQNQPLKQMPNSSVVLNNYLTNGTTIAISSLPLWDRNYLANAGAEVGLGNWTANNCDVTQSVSQKKSGSYSFFINNRNILPLTFPSYIYQDVTSQIAGGISFNVKSWIYVPGVLNQDNFRIRVQINATGGNTSFLTAWTPSGFDTWTMLSGAGTITWSGTLQSAYWYVESQLLATPYYLDDCEFKETLAEANTRVVHRALLSPQTNSLNGVTNSQGIYVIDCQGQTVNVRDCRILGTLVLRDPSGTSRIEGSMHCDSTISDSTSVDVPNILSVISDKKVKIALSATNLDERLANRNFNPTGTPYQDLTDSDLSDTYPAQITGIIYSLDDLQFGGTTTVFGAVISEKKVTVSGTNPLTTTLTVHHNALYRYVNPPVEFRDTPVVTLKSGSASRVVD
jgi:hypothetical protein